MTTAELIRTARRKRGLRQFDLAIAIDKSTYYVALLEQGRRRPSRAVAAAISAALRIDIDTSGLRPYNSHSGEAGCGCYACGRRRLAQVQAQHVMHLEPTP